MSHIGNDTIIDNERDDQGVEHMQGCCCERCEGICGLGMCGQCAGCEELAAEVRLELGL